MRMLDLAWQSLFLVKQMSCKNITILQTALAGGCTIDDCNSQQEKGAQQALACLCCEG
jgi:hypothetical protein